MKSKKLKSKIKFSKINDNAFNGEKLNWMDIDECGIMVDTTITKRWDMISKVIFK